MVHKAQSRGKTMSTKPSVSHSFPAELIEAILDDIDTSDLVIAAAALPPFWRRVIETSQNLKRRIYTYRSFDNGASRAPYERLSDSGDLIRLYECRFPDGTLLVHQRLQDGAEGLAFLPDQADSPLRILNPADKIVKYTKGRFYEYGFIDIRDMDGALVCSRTLSSSNRDVLWMYVVANCIVEDETAAIRKRKVCEMAEEEAGVLKRMKVDAGVRPSVTVGKTKTTLFNSSEKHAR